MLKMGSMDKRSKLSLIGSVVGVLALVSFIILWKTTPFETSEMPVAVIAVSAAAVVFFGVAVFKNWLHVVNVLSFASSTVAMYLLIMGRASYVAFYFTGDAMNTGFSLFAPLTLVLMAANVVIGGLAIFSEKA